MLVAHRHFIGSSFAGPGHGAITLRGDIDSSAADQFAEHLDGFLDAASRLISVDATQVRSCHPRVLEVLSRAQLRMDARGGLLTVVGLHPTLLPAAAAPSPVPGTVASITG
jgi:anti-anti-sigma regulatory factor